MQARKELNFLVVDDMKAIVRLHVNILNEIGYQNVFTAYDGLPAWKTLEGQYANGSPIDIIISDWNMPELSGLELLKMCKADERFSKIPFLMVSAIGEELEVISALKEGVSNYVVKPFNRETIEEKINYILKIKRQAS